MDPAGVPFTGAPPSRTDAPPPRAFEPAGIDGHRLPVGRHVLVHGRLSAARPVAPCAVTVRVQRATATTAATGLVAVFVVGRRGVHRTEARGNRHVCKWRWRRRSGRVHFSGRRIGYWRRWMPAEPVPNLRQDVRAA